MKVRVSSFQSIRSATIEAIGFTAITGRSNIGKSALLRAISGALFGMEGDHFVRKGDASCAVTVEHGGHHFEWSKGRGACLILDDAKHTRLGKNGHAELTAPLGYQSVVAGRESIRPQVANQHDDIFLLTTSPSAAAEVFKMLGRIDVVTRAQGAAKGDLRKANGELEIRTRDQETAWESLCEMGWLELLEEGFRKLTEKVEVADSKVVEAGVHLGLLEDFDAIDEDRAIPEEPILPNADPIQDLLDQIDELTALGAPLGDLPETPDLTTTSSDATQESLYALENFATSVALVEMAEKETAEAVELETQLTARRHELEHELGVCPTCENPFPEDSDE